MKIMWLCNVELPIISKIMDKQESVYGGWLTTVADQLTISNTLIVIYPDSNRRSGTIGNMRYYSFNDNNAEEIMKNTLILEKPDVIHIWGTEYQHSNILVKALEKCNMIDNCILSIQGLVSIIANHYKEGIPERVYRRYTIRDFLRHDNIAKAQKQFCKRGEYEIDTIKRVKHIIGRTDWDYACVKRLNPTVDYNFCNETLRNEFYTGEWNLNSINRHSIFVSQCSYPVKGFHRILEAMTDIISEYPDTHIYTTGKNLISLNNSDRFRLTSYQKYIRDLIIKKKLENNITFLGMLDATQMKEQYLSANVFVSASSIENSPNSVGEAMLLGCPVVSSFVGGTMNMIRHGEEGYLYQATAPYMLANYVKKIFSDDTLAKSISKKGRAKALITHDKETNYSALMSIYKKIHNREVV